MYTAVTNPQNDFARSQMMLAATIAGIGFGNAGCHLPHGMSYPVSGMVRNYSPKGYENNAIVPHGMAVILNAPAVFRFTADSNLDRHERAAKIMGEVVKNKEDIENSLAKIAALLIHVAKIDENYTQKEREIIKKAIMKLSSKNEVIDNVLIKAEEIEKNSNQILDFTREVKNMNKDSKSSTHIVTRDIRELITKTINNHQCEICGNELDKDKIEYLKSHPEETKFSETLEIVVKSIPGAMEKLKSIDGEVEKLEYYNELLSIVQKLENFREGKENPN